ncbi:hypothetical protein [Streptococcus suis]|uniref:hypothetical protein n=1 Tax=Streptococcus suis TaxID=1307 RepID=UPI000CF57862|nr:hypothetical protein [Streptococcus suis]
MKKLTLISIAVLSFFSLVACTSGSSNSVGVESTSSTSSEDATASSSYTSTAEFDSNKDNYSNLTLSDYDTWNHDLMENGKKVKVSGKIVQAMYDDGDTIVRLAFEGNYDNMILALIDDSQVTDTISENDYVTLYGYTSGRYTYESTFGAEITIPYMAVGLYEDYLGSDYQPKVLYDQNGIKLEQTNYYTFKLTNNSSIPIQSTIESIDVNRQVISSYGLSDLSYAELSSGQWKEATMRDSDGLLKEGATVNIVLEIMNDDYDVIATIPISFTLEKTVID